MNVSEKQLEEFLLDSGLTTKDRIDEALRIALGDKRYLGDVLVERGDITKDELRKTEAYILGIPFVNLQGQRLDFETLSLIPEPIARGHNIIAFNKTIDSLEVAMLDVHDLTAIDFIKKKVNLKILARLTDTESIKSALLQYQKSLKAEFGDIIDKAVETLKVRGTADETTEDKEDLRKLAEDLPIVRIVDTLIRHAIIQSASDIHIEPLESQVLIRYRIDGVLHDTMSLPSYAASGIIARIKVLSNLKLDEKRLPQDGRFRV